MTTRGTPSAVAGVLAAVTLAACGGTAATEHSLRPEAGGVQAQASSHSSDVPAPAHPSTLPRRAVHPTARVTDPRVPAAHRHHHTTVPVRPTAASRSRHRHTMTRAQALHRLPGADRTKLVLHTVRRILEGLGFHGAYSSVSSAGRVVEVNLRVSQGCLAHADEARRILATLTPIVPYPRTVTVTVGAGRAPVASYVRAHCAPPGLPSGSGRILLAKDGSHFYETAPFTVHAKRWSIAWANRGTYFQVFVMKGSEAQPHPISTFAPGSGTQAYQGPGTFRLRISGMDEWRVRVREG